MEVIECDENDNLLIETDNRQLLFDTAIKYSKNIICLDADEYLDGRLKKHELEKILEDNPNTTFHLQWIQYTSINTVRVDGPWKFNLKDRIGNFDDKSLFLKTQKHSTHLPSNKVNKRIEKDDLFIAHLHWLNKTYDIENV